jgi:signal peptidase I
MTTTIRKLGRVAGYAVTCFLIAVAVFAVAEYATGVQPFYVVTDNPSSMSPTINYGDLAVIYGAPFSSVGPGSIIAFHDPRGNPGIIVHGVVASIDCGGNKCLVTKGANNATNPTTDPWNVTQGYYIGEVILVVPYLGYISPALWGFNGIYALLPISTVGLVILFVSVFQHKPKGTETKEEIK